MLILGINAYHGDVSAALVCDGELVAAVEEERFRRVKHWAGFPRESIRACLQIAKVSPRQIDCIAVSRDPRAHLLRKALFTLRHLPSPTLVLDRMRNSMRIRRLDQRIAQELELDEEKVRQRLRWVEHHPAHMGSAFFVSPFEEAAILAMDGFGDFVSTSQGVGRGAKVEVLQKTYFPHSLGMMYLGITQYLGFPRYGDEYKVMGLAAYGKPEYVKQLRQLIHLKRDGGFELDLSYFRHWSDGVSMTWDDGEPFLSSVYTGKLEKLLGPARGAEDPIEPRHEAIAASLQRVFEETALHLLNHLYCRSRIPRLCLAGGCALNSVLNGKIRERTPFREVYIQPAAADNGTALGAAFAVCHGASGRSRRFVMEHAYWGPQFSQEELSRGLRAKGHELANRGCQVTKVETEEELCQKTASAIAGGKIVGWFQGRMEWGARALGNRSILADPRDPKMKEILNTKIKFRENFRPFAPSVLEEAVGDYFFGAVSDPFMIQVYPIRPEKRSVIPAVTHVDGSGRLHTVSQKSNPLYWKLIKTFEHQTGVPVLLNTSFNENEPIVHRPEEALDCFLRTGMDMLVLGKNIIEKRGG